MRDLQSSVDDGTRPCVLDQVHHALQSKNAPYGAFLLDSLAERVSAGFELHAVSQHITTPFKPFNYAELLYQAASCVIV